MPHPFAPIRWLLPALLLGLASCDQQTPSAAPASSAAAADKAVQVPEIAGAVNGPGDWSKQGHQVLILNPVDNAPGAKVELAMAWTPSAFLLQAHADDATPFETNDELWNGDSVGLVLASSLGSDDHIEIVCSPGRTVEHPQPRWHVYDKRIAGPAMVAPEVHATHDAQGYTLTVSVPWANLSHVPKAGDVIGVQVYVNDAQGENPLAHRTWYPGLATGDPLQMERVQLADQADPPEIATARVHPKGFNDFAVEVLAIPEAAGKNIEILSGGKQVASGTLAPGGFDGDSAADIPLPPDLAAQKDAPLAVTVDGQPVPTAFKVPDLAALRLGLVRDQPMTASPSTVFDGTAFPKIDFLNRDLVEAAIGSYTLHPRFFDGGWNEVTAPAAPGRYGALVDFRSGDGLTCTRQVTLFKTAHPYNPAKDPYGATVQFPAAFGFPTGMLANEQWNVNDWTGEEMEYLAGHDDWVAPFLAGLHDLATDPARLHGFHIWKIEQDWWAELFKRQGADQEYPHLTHLPDGYDKDQKAWPLIVFLHGSGSRGNDLDMVKNDGPLHYIHEGHPLPFIIVTPQCPSHEGWISARLAHLIDEVSAANRVDPKRIYVTGLSMGGRGTWDVAASYPDKFAAIAPVAGEEDPAIAERLKNMPTWVFHGSEDTVVPTRYSLDIVDAMQGLGAPVKLTLYPGLGHGGWDMTYDNPALYAWFLQYSK